VISFTPRSLYSGKRAPETHWIGGWVDPRACLDDVEISFDPTGTELRPLGRPARSQSLYRLRYPGSQKKPLNNTIWKCSPFTEGATSRFQEPVSNGRQKGGQLQHTWTHCPYVWLVHDDWAGRRNIHSVSRRKKSKRNSKHITFLNRTHKIFSHFTEFQEQGLPNGIVMRFPLDDDS
jgi:hypothetical protein